MLRKLLVLAVTVPVIALVQPSSPAQARACQVDYRCTTTYYSDSSHTTVVGQLFEGCAGDRSSWGTHGSSATFVETPC